MPSSPAPVMAAFINNERWNSVCKHCAGWSPSKPEMAAFRAHRLRRLLFPRGGKRARFDQQPIEAQSTVSACIEAFEATEDSFWRDEARRAFEWFVGRNDLDQPLYNPSSGGCYDGLHFDRVNFNQGAESTLAFLLGTHGDDHAADIERFGSRRRLTRQVQTQLRGLPGSGARIEHLAS